VIHDIPISPEPSISGTRVRRSRGVGVRGIGDFEGKKLLQIGIVKHDIPMEELCGPQQELVEDRCRPYRGSGKGKSESIDIRIRDPVNPKIMIEVTGGGKVNPHDVHRCIGISKSGISEASCFRHHRCRNPDGRIPDRNRWVLTFTHRVLGYCEAQGARPRDS
jgi:hypothetical protein